MSDFLGRLAARALGQVPPVRPRLPSRFEPAAGLVEEVVEASPVSAPPRLSRPSPRPVGERREDLGARLGEPAVPASEARRAPDLASPAVAPLRGEPSLPNPSLPASPPPGGREGLKTAPGSAAVGAGLVPARQHRERGQAPPLQQPPAEVSLFSRQAGGRLGEEGRGDEGQRTGSADAASFAIPAPPTEPAFRIDETVLPAASPGPRIEPSAEPALPAHRPLVPRAALRQEPPPAALASPSSRAEAGPAAAAAPEPTIRVTIGRIEVRSAAPAPPAAPAPRPAAPRLSLEEYLRRRNEERM
ncbi:MAG TPA: hypothetical protein VFR03_21205 [Thermoanaerobaculia bacterium]|nr:hypothetical protein [Thermoanaerobaculia bacterium]